jgi:glycosyltransferase involved in cell wall biosynthesis
MSSAIGPKLKVLHIASGLATGGAETMLFRLLRALPPDERKMHGVLSLSDNCAFDFNSLGTQVNILDLKSFSNPISALIALRKLIQFLSPRLIHTWMYHANITTTLAAPSHIPIIWGIHHALQNFSEESRSLKLLIRLGKVLSRKRNIVKLVFVSHASERQHLNMGYSTEKSVVIPNGIDTNEFFPSEELRLKQREALGIDEKFKLIGSFGRFHPIKDHRNLIKALSIVRSVAPHQHIALVLAGKDMDSKNSSLLALLNHDHLADITHLIGPQTDMCALYNALDLYVLSSKSESLPNVLAESLACGTPVVTTDVGDAKRMTPDPSFSAPPNSPTALANEISRFLLLDKVEVKKMGDRGRSHVIASFNIEKTLFTHMAIYEKVLAEWTN